MHWWYVCVCRVYSSCNAVMLGKRMPVTLLPTLFYERNLEWRFMCLQSVSFCPCKLSRSNMKLWEKNMQSKGGNLMVKAVQFPPVRRDAMSRRLNADLMFWSAVMFHLSGGIGSSSRLWSHLSGLFRPVCVSLWQFIDTQDFFFSCVFGYLIFKWQGFFPIFLILV